MAVLDHLDPDMDCGRFVDDPAFIRRFNVSGGRAHLAYPVPLVEMMPAPLQALNKMTGSFAVIIGLIEANLCALPPPSTTHLSRRFGLSRAQVRNVIAAGCSADLFVPAGPKEIRPHAPVA